MTPARPHFTLRCRLQAENRPWEGKSAPTRSEDNTMVRQTTTPKKDLGTGTNKPPKPGEDPQAKRAGNPERSQQDGQRHDGHEDRKHNL